MTIPFYIPVNREKPALMTEFASMDIVNIYVGDLQIDYGMPYPNLVPQMENKQAVLNTMDGDQISVRIIEVLGTNHMTVVLED